MLFNNNVDSDWLRQSFLLPEGAIDARDQLRRTFTEATRKFTDTTLGGNYAINSPAQFTRYADHKRHRLGPSQGMGRRYSEMIDEPSQLVHLRFGVPEYNSLDNFFTSYYNAEMSLMARQGRTNSFWFGLGELVGFVVGIPLQLPIFVSRVLDFMMGVPRSKYYYLKPTMTLYWNAVNSICNELAVNLALVPALIQNSYDNNKHGEFSSNKIDQKMIDSFNYLLPDVMRGSGGIDIYAVANRAHRLQRMWNDKVVKIMEHSGLSLDNATAALQQMEQEQLSIPKSKRGIKEAMELYLGTNAGQGTAMTAEEIATNNDSLMAAGNLTTEGEDGAVTYNEEQLKGLSEAVAARAGEVEEVGSFWPKDDGLRKRTWDYLVAEEQDGAQFATFRVDHTGTSSESFSNTTKESDLQQMFNSASSTARETRFSLADGNVVGVLGSFVKAASDLAAGALEKVGLSGMLGLTGSAFVDIPKHWDSSTAQLPRAEFTVKLRSPYGNDLSRMMALYVPLAMLLAGALPLSTGNSSYTSPFLCECYSRGRCQIRLGMIESLSISRGEGNLGWNRDQKPLGIDVTFSVVDMSSIMHMPLSQATGWHDVGKITATLLGEDSTYRDYMSVLSSLTLSSQIYQFPKLFRNITRITENTNAFFSASHLASYLGGSTVGRWVSGALTGANRL